MSSQQFQIKIGVNSSGVTSGITTAVNQVSRLVKGFLALGAVQFGRNLVQSAIDFGSNIKDIADRSKIGVESFQAMAAGVEKAGGTIEDYAKSVKGLSFAQIGALRGNMELEKAFARYGVTLENLRKMNPEQLFRAVAKGMAAAPASAQVTTDAQAIFGKSGDVMLGAIRNGLIESAEEAERLGLILKKDIVEELDNAGDAIEQMNKKWKVFAATVVGTGIRNIRQNFQEITNFMVAGKVGGWVADFTKNPALGEAVSKMLFQQRQAQDSAKEEADRKTNGAVSPGQAAEDERREKMMEEGRKRMVEQERAQMEAAKKKVQGPNDPRLQLTSNQQAGALVLTQMRESEIAKNTAALKMHARVLEEWRKKDQRTAMGGINDMARQGARMSYNDFVTGGGAY